MAIIRLNKYYIIDSTKKTLDYFVYLTNPIEYVLQDKKGYKGIGHPVCFVAVTRDDLCIVRGVLSA